MKITDKFKDILKEEDLKELNKSIEALISERVALKVEEKIVELEKKAEEFTTKQIEEGLKEKEEKLLKEYDEKLVELESTIVDKLDKFLDSEINENISDKALEKVAINETFKPIIENIKKLFEDSYVDLDTEGYGILKEAKEEIEKLEEKVSDNIASKIELKAENDKLKAKILIDEKVIGLNEEEIKRVKTFFEDKSFSEVESKIDEFVNVVIDENKSSKDDKNKAKVNEDVNASNDNIDDKKKDNVNEDTVISKAGNLLD